jgi:hypothetical protein
MFRHTACHRNAGIRDWLPVSRCHMKHPVMNPVNRYWLEFAQVTHLKQARLRDPDPIIGRAWLDSSDH